MASHGLPPAAWTDPDQVEAAMGQASRLAHLFAARDHGEGRYAPSYGTSPEAAAAHDLYCKLYDRLTELDPARTAFAGSGGGWHPAETGGPGAPA